MIEPTRRVETETRSGGGRNRAIDKIDGFRERAGLVRIG